MAATLERDLTTLERDCQLKGVKKSRAAGTRHVDREEREREKAGLEETVRRENESYSAGQLCSLVVHFLIPTSWSLMASGKHL